MSYVAEGYGTFKVRIPACTKDKSSVEEIVEDLFQDSPFEYIVSDGELDISDVSEVWEDD